ncbi:MAG TPA: hypothetical protein VFI31_00965 [Pirellulales bacterium]|nr:hypothetical protein [Pirellulales bacterium]
MLALGVVRLESLTYKNAVGRRIVTPVTRPPAECRLSSRRLLTLAGIGWLVMSGDALHNSPSFAAAASNRREAASTHYMAVGGVAESRQCCSWRFVPTAGP